MDATNQSLEVETHPGTGNASIDKVVSAEAEECNNFLPRPPEGRQRFANLVERVTLIHDESNPNVYLPYKGAAAFKAAAHSVLSHPANRKYMADQQMASKRSQLEGSAKRRKRLVLGSQTLTVDEDDPSIMMEENSSPTNPRRDPEAPVRGSSFGSKALIGKIMKAAERKVSNCSSEGSCSSSKRTRKLSFPPHPLSKRESNMSLTSSCSIDSDWSDEELEEVERMFGAIQQKLNAASSYPDSCAGSNSRSPSPESHTKWQKTTLLAVQRLLAMRKKKALSTGGNSPGGRSISESTGVANMSDMDSIDMVDMDYIMDLLVEEEENTEGSADGSTYTKQSLDGEPTTLATTPDNKVSF